MNDMHIHLHWRRGTEFGEGGYVRLAMRRNGTEGLGSMYTYMTYPLAVTGPTPPPGAPACLLRAWEGLFLQAEAQRAQSRAPCTPA